MADIIPIALKIEQKIEELEELRRLIKPYAEKKAEAIARYDRMMAIAIIKLKNGDQYLVDNNIVVNPPTTILEKVARGICWEEKLEAEKADGMYKALISNIEVLQAILNGFQSINRHLGEV